jgi:acyl-CoA synthetase (AMP-forming)/AMP-acid ligase II
LTFLPGEASDVWPEGSPATFVEVLQRWAIDRGDERALTFVTDGIVETEALTFADIDRQARSIAAHLSERLQPGDRALLLYPPTLAFVPAFFGCLFAGVTAVPAYPPSPRTVDRVVSIMGDARPSAVLTPASIGPLVRAGLEEELGRSDLPAIETDGLDDRSSEWKDPGIGPETVAFLQYTSGSTGDPRGVVMTHRNLISNQRAIQQSFGTNQGLVVVGWLPLHHDMGLNGNVLHPIYLGGRAYVMSPVEFLKRPYRWLQALSHFRANTSGGPNFAFERCVRKVTDEERATLDLSAWTTAFNGAEPIDPDTVERFIEVFARCGFRPEAMSPCYGLAEATVCVTGRPPLSGALIRSFDIRALEEDGRAVPKDGANTRRLVSSGHAWADQRVVIADPALGVALPDGTVGEIWTSGGNVAPGYWHREPETRQTFSATLADTGEGPFLRTGDLGFVLDGELYVTGRLKDLIIIRGRNYYPQDIERTLDAAGPAVRPGCGVAFGLEVEGEERLVIVQEIDDDPATVDVDAVVAAIRRQVAAHHGVRAHDVVLIPRGEIPKTSSGKLQRSLTKERYLAGSLPAAAGNLLAEKG